MVVTRNTHHFDAFQRLSKVHANGIGFACDQFSTPTIPVLTAISCPVALTLVLHPRRSSDPEEALDAGARLVDGSLGLLDQVAVDEETVREPLVDLERRLHLQV
jgi:hypothetical protein